MPYEYKQTLYTLKELTLKAREKAICNEQQNPYSAANTEYEVQADEFINNFKKFLETCGVDSPDFQYSGFWSQGDGGSTTGEIKLSQIFPDEEPSKVETECNNFIDKPLESIQMAFKDSLKEEQLKIVKKYLQMHDMNFSVYRYRGSHYVHEQTLCIEPSVDLYSRNEGLNVRGEDMLDEEAVMEAFDEELKQTTNIKSKFVDFLEELVLDYFKDISQQVYRALSSLFDGCKSEESIAEMFIDNEVLFLKDGTAILWGITPACTPIKEEESENEQKAEG